MKGHGQTPRFWFSESTQAVHDWAMNRALIQAKTPLEMATEKAQLRSAMNEGDVKPVFGDGSQDYMMQRYKNLALIQISGTLVKSDSYWNRYFGMVSYDEIRRSVLTALKDDSVQGIMAIMATPGGSAAGADAMATFFSKADQVKPFYSFAETDMCSGGYYLGAPSREIYAQRAAQVGSIGVIMVHMDMVEMYKENGITPTVFRAGEFKALGSPYEHLDKRAKENIQGTLNDYFNMFNDHVVACRGFKDVPALLAEAGEGRVFMAEKAKEVGLVDQVAELEDALEEVSDKVRSSSGKRTTLSVSTQTRGSAMDRSNAQAAAASGQALTPEQIAALAAGANLGDVGGQTPAAAQAAAVGTEAGEQAPAPVAEGEQAPAVSAAQVAEGEQAPAVTTAPADASVLVDKVLALGTENAQLKADLKAEQTAKAELQARAEAAEATITGLSEIVAQAINHRQVALGYQPSDVSALTPNQKIEQFAKLDADFKERFKAGQVSRPTQAAVQAASLSPVADAARGMTGKL